MFEVTFTYTNSDHDTVDVREAHLKAFLASMSAGEAFWCEEEQWGFWANPNALASIAIKRSS